MTKKDYELIAKCIKDSRDLPVEIRLCGDNPLYTSHEDLLANLFASNLINTSPRFDKEKFLKACGVENTHIHDYLASDVIGNKYQYNCQTCGYLKSRK